MVNKLSSIIKSPSVKETNKASVTFQGAVEDLPVKEASSPNPKASDDEEDKPDKTSLLDSMKQSRKSVSGLKMLT